MISKGISRTFDAMPDMDFLGMGQNDGTNFCECEECRTLDTGEMWSKEKPVITERWLSFINNVSENLYKNHPGKKIYTLAYHQTFRPPDPEIIKPNPNVIIQVVNSRPNYVCFVHRFKDEDCPRHVKFCEGLEDWIDMTRGKVMVYEYNPHSTFANMPYPAVYKFIEDINYLHKVGVGGYEGQSSVNIWGTYGINHYAIAKATWDYKIKAEDLVKDYCDHAFGNGSESMQKFLKVLDKGLKEADHITEGVWTYMTPEIMTEARKFLDKAHSEVEDPAFKRRLREYEIGFHYGELASEAWWKADKANKEKNAELMKEAIDSAEQAVQYLLDENETAPHHAASDGKLTTVYLRRWRSQLERM